MLINSNDGPVDISLNTRYYDISHPFGAIRTFIVTTEPDDCDGIVCWTAVSDDCYREEIHVRLSSDNTNKILIIAVRRNFYHKVSCLFESSSGTLTGSSGLL